jgi:transglutaminase-like putative cysteine protease
MPLDILNAASLGFHSDSKELHKKITSFTDTVQIKRHVSSLPDGLSNGIVNTTIHMALDTKIRYPWTNSIPRHIFMEYVLPYCVVNEARTHWRPLVYDAIQPTLQRLVDDNSSTMEQVVREINKDLWTALGKPSLFYNDQGEVSIRKDPIVFKAGQTPLIYDPMSILQYGYASCTGLSILLVDALRCAGIPARLVGTRCWNNNEVKKMKLHFL